MHVPTSPNGAHANGHTHSSKPAPDTGPGAKQPAADGGRDPHGRFAQGNRGGPGNPFAHQVAALRSALVASVTAEDLEAIARELLRQAKEGNVAAAKLLLSYALGKPTASVDPDTLDAQEWDNYRRAPDPAQDIGALASRMPLPLACRITRDMLPGLERDWTRQFAEGFRQFNREEQLGAAARAERAARRAAKAERRRQGPAAPSANGNIGAGGAPDGAAGPRRPPDERRGA
jgi:hypothetical protein